MKSYSVLKKQIYSEEIYSIVPIRYEDRFDIMKWRNEQIYHLRQNKLLTKEAQEYYFSSVIASLFLQEKPNQILFSFLENEKCIGYGGLVHINWIDKNAEVSFIMDTAFENQHFYKYWNIFLKLLREVAFHELNFHKTYVYAFDLRPHLYGALEKSGYFFDARLLGHCEYNGQFKDVIIYSLLNK